MRERASTDGGNQIRRPAPAASVVRDVHPAPVANGPILVADDDPDIRALVGDVLTDAGFTVRRATNGTEALAMAGQWRPAALVLDLAMPQLDGYQVLERLHADAATRDIPVLVLTAYATRADAAAALAAGADDFLAKPFDVDELIVRVSALIKRRTPATAEARQVLRIQLFGPLRVSVGDRAAMDEHFTRRKAKALFAYLYLNRGRYVSKDELLEALWPEAEHAGPGRLKQTVLTVRLAIEPTRAAGMGSRYILEKGGFYYFHTNAEYSSDVEDFEHDLALARDCQGRGEAECALGHYERAFELRRGEFLPEFRYEDWAATEQARLQELYLEGLEDAARLYGSRREHGRAVELLRIAIREDALRESSYLDLMRFLWLDGKHPEALRVYHRLREVLTDQLQVEPEPEATRLYEAIRRDRATGGEAAHDESQG